MMTRATRQKSVLIAKAGQMEGSLGRLADDVVGVDAHLHRVGHQPDGAEAGFHHFLLGAADYAGEIRLRFLRKGTFQVMTYSLAPTNSQRSIM